MASVATDAENSGRGGSTDRRGRVVRGTILNSGFLVAITALGLVRVIVVARVLPVVDYGIWGVLSAMIGAAFYLKDLGISDKFVQQDEADQAAAFAKAVNAEAIVCCALFVLIVATSGLLALGYGRMQLWPAGSVLATVVLAQIYQSPTWVFYRRMDYKRQRRIQAIDPVVGFIITVVLALVGLGYWSLILGTVAAAWTVAFVTTHVSPYPVRPRLRLAGLKEYRTFSAPLLVTAVVGIIIDELSVILGTVVVGFAGVAAITLSVQINSYAQQIEVMIADTLYPAVCAVKDNHDVMKESFVKSNRLGLLWALPAGAGVALFFPDVVTFVIGAKWRPAEAFVEVMALIAALNVVGFSWTAYYRATARTGALARASILAAIIFVSVTVPAGIILGLPGIALGFGSMTVFNVCVRGYYLGAIFSGFSLALHVLRSVAAVLPACAVVLTVRVLTHDEKSAPLAVAELAAFCGLTAIFAYVAERQLIKEIVSYIVGRRSTATATAA